MRRKLISIDAFDKIKSESLSNAESELMEASNLLAQTLGSGPLNFRFFDDEKAVYETEAGTFIHANYKLAENKLHFENITELVVDSDSLKKSLRGCVSKMVEAIIDGNETEANKQFENYCDLFCKARKSGVTQEISEEAVVRVDNRSGDVKKWKGTDPEKKKAAKANWAKNRSKLVNKRHERENPSKKSEEGRKHEKNKQKGIFNKLSLIRTGKAKKKVNEWNNLCENVSNYLNFVETNSWAGNSSIDTNENGDVVTVSIPTKHSRNEGKILSLQYKTLKTDVKVLREAARGLANNQDFCKAISLVKRFNNLSQNNELEESINKLVQVHPNVLYLTQPELAKIVGQALENVGQVNYDDQTCAFIAEGILRTAHSVYTDRVNRISSLANAPKVEENEDAYATFQVAVSDFYSKLDEALGAEMQMFTDLYNTLVDVRRLALEANNESVRDVANDYLKDLHAVVEGGKAPELDLAEEVASWLQNLVEANLADASEDWAVSNTPYETEVGEHPQMAKNAKQAGNSGSYTGDWGDEAPVSDGKSYKGHSDEMRSRSWGNKGGKDTWPSLNNPYVPSSSDFTLKGEPGVDKNGGSSFGQEQGDTWPELQNPYIPKAVMPKMKSDNLVVEK